MSKHVLVIDDDQGQSGSSAEGRAGFQRLLAEISLDRVGMILGLEMSRLARSCKDWHALLELCAIYRTLLADADGVYDPSDYNDRLLLGLKGTMSEAELHILKSRLHHGMWNKAQRGELLNHAPIGYVRTAAGDFVMGDGVSTCGMQEHPVTLTRDFFLGQHEVSNGEYLQLLQWAYDEGHVTATTAGVWDALDGSTELLPDDCIPDFVHGTPYFILFLC